MDFNSTCQSRSLVLPGSLKNKLIMVVIFSKSTDASTTDVIRWIKYYGEEAIRINYDDPQIKFCKEDIIKNQIIFTINNRIINLLDAKSVWFRRNGLSYNMFDVDLIKLFNNNVFSEKKMNGFVYYHIKEEINTLIEHIYFSLEHKCKALGSYFNSNLNKLNVLQIAQKNGLKIPCTYITNNIKDIIAWTHHGSYITKALSDGIYFATTKNAYYTYTEKIDNNYISNINRKLCCSLLQEQIKKKYEVRSFYLNGDFYSMAIFSQSNSKTCIDFRKYDTKLPNRYIPYKLPDEIECALRKIMDCLKLNTGSVDLMVDENNKFYFLEINPVGQFGMVSEPCNYLLEKRIAEFLVF